MNKIKILVIKPSALGDIIHTLPTVAAIQQEYNAHIGWVVSAPFKNLLENTFIDKLYIFERNSWGGLKFFKNFFKIVAFMRSIQREKYDIVIDFQGLLRTGIITLLSGSKKRIGFANARELSPLSYNIKVKTPSNVVHAIERYRLLAHEINVKNITDNFPIAIPESLKQKIKAMLPDKYIVIVPGARWLSKRWPPEYFAELIDKIFEHLNMITVIVGAPNESPIGKEIEENVANKKAINNLIGQTSLQELCYVLQAATIVVSNDSGPMHLAAAVKTKTVALFGPTDPDKIRPYGENHIVLKRDNICAKKCKRICFQDLKCLRAISPQEVFSVLQEHFKAMYQD